MRISYLKYFYILLIVFILSMLGSFAFFSWGSDDSNNTNVSFDVVADTVYIYYDAGSSLNGADLYPTDDKSDGVSKDITVKIDKVVQSKPVTFNLYLDLTDVPDGLMDDSFKWALYDGDIQIKTGSITDATANCSTNNTKHITLLSDSIDTIEQQNYVLYLWIDGNMSNPDTMMNKSFKVNLHADGVNATLVEGKQIDIISINRNISNISSISLRSSNYNFNSYSLDGENGTWINFDCSDDKCNTDENKVYETNLSNLSLEFVDGIASIWVKNTNNDIQKLDIGRSYSITLDNDGASSGGTTIIYGVYKDGFYSDSSFENKYDDGDRIDIPIKTNSDFLGYYTAKTGGNKVINNNGEFVMDSIYYEDITLYARWQQATYNVVYDCTTNGGSTAITTSVVDGGTNADLTKTCSKSGWTFVGWNTSSTATSKLSSYTVSSNVTLYGIYRKEAITYTASTYKNISSAIGTNSTASCTIAAVYNNNTQATSCNITLPSNPYTFTNWTFNGWVSGSGITTTTKTSGSASGTSLSISSNINLVATWKRDYTATFYTYQGNKTATCTAYNNNICTFTLPSIDNSGPDSSTYYGISTSLSSTTTTTTYNSTYLNYYTVYTGSWIASYSKENDNISSIGKTTDSCSVYKYYNGTTYTSTTCKITLPDINPITGYMATGWYDTSSNKMGDASDSITLSSNVSYIAKSRKLTASDFSFDNSHSGMNCNDVQCAIDELNINVASDFSYDNSKTGVNCSDVKCMLDELYNMVSTSTQSISSDNAIAPINIETYNVNYPLDTSDNKTISDINTEGLITITSNNSYDWSIDSTHGLRSNNNGVGSSTGSTQIVFTPTVSAKLSFDYGVSSESSYDKLTITLTGGDSSSEVIANAISGTTTGSVTDKTLTKNVTYTLALSYTKDSSVDRNDDLGYIKNFKIVGDS